MSAVQEIPAQEQVKEKPAVEPVGHRVLVKVEKVEEKTRGGIIIPENRLENEKTACSRGVLVAMGQQAYVAICDGSLWVEEGDTVVFEKYSGILVSIDGQEHRIMNDKDILFRITDPDAEIVFKI